MRGSLHVHCVCSDKMHRWLKLLRAERLRVPVSCQVATRKPGATYRLRIQCHKICQKSWWINRECEAHISPVTMMTVGCMAPALWSQLRQRWCHWKRCPRCHSTLSSKCRQWCRWNQPVKAKEQKARNDKKSFVHFVFRLWFGVVYLNVTNVICSSPDGFSML